MSLSSQTSIRERLYDTFPHRGKDLGAVVHFQRPPSGTVHLSVVPCVHIPKSILVQRFIDLSYHCHILDSNKSLPA